MVPSVGSAGDPIVAAGSAGARRKRLIAGGLAVLLIAGGIILYQITFHQPEERARAKACAAPLLKQAGKVTSPSNRTELGNIIEKVQAKPDYKQDADCMFLVTIYYVNMQDAKKAKQSLAEFKEVYDASKGVDPLLLGGYYNDVAKLESSVQYLSQLSGEAAKNVRGADL